MPTRSSRRTLAAAASIGCLALLLLAPVVEIDPVPGITFSNAPFSDEAYNLIGARSLVLLGHRRPTSGRRGC